MALMRPWALGLLATVDTPASTCGAVKANGSLSKHPRSRFALKVKLQAGEDRAEGELSYADEAGRLFFESTSIDTFVITAHHASIAGQGRANGATVGFQVEVTDGRPHTFAIQLSNGYAAAGTVAGGHTKIEECEDGEDGEDR